MLVLAAPVVGASAGRLEALETLLTLNFCGFVIFILVFFSLFVYQHYEAMGLGDIGVGAITVVCVVAPDGSCCGNEAGAVVVLCAGIDGALCCVCCCGGCGCCGMCPTCGA